MKYLLSILMISISLLAFNQQGDGGVPKGPAAQQNVLVKIPTVYFEEPDIQKLQAEDHVNDSLKIGPWRFGYNYDTHINLYDQAVWIPTKDGGKVGLLKISAKDAKTINLMFSNTTIPSGNALYVYDPDQSMVLGKFTQRHIYKGELGTELIPGHTVIVEYDVSPSNTENMGNVAISRVTYGYRTAKELKHRIFGSSQSCEMNVNCPDGAPYIQQRNSAVMLVVGSNGFCSGALINNTAYDGKPYVLTANHCTLMHGNYASWIFRFKWQSPTCSNPPSSPPFESLSGATLLAKRDHSDFCLVKITGGLVNGTISQNYNPYFAGWNRGNPAPPSTFCIHHPKGDIAKISFDDNPPVVSQGMGSPEANSTWKVVWDRNTATESASSGSPLFNNAGQIIGQLWGGTASCSNSGIGHDYYGRLHNSWDPLGSNSTNQLKYWLDPNHSGDTSITGYDPYVTPTDYNAAAINIKGVDGAACQTLFYPKAIIQNRGSKVLTSLTIHYTYNGGSEQTIQWTGNLTTYQTASVQLPPITNIQGQNQVEIQVENPNGQPDAITSDNSFSVDYHASPSGSTLDFTFYMGCFSSETSWLLKNDAGDTLYSGVGSINESNANHYVLDTFCLKDGCYDLVLKDSYGDGVSGSVYPDCDYDGSMTLINDESRDTLAELPVSAANFGYEKTYHFCLTAHQPSAVGLKDLLVYPNPSNGEFKVETALKGMKRVRLFSVAGQKIIDFQTGDYHFTINQNNQLAAGIYFLQVGNGAHEIIRKVFVR